MKWTAITANGTHVINEFDKSVQGAVTILTDADIGTSSVSIGYLDSTGTAVPFADGTLAAGEAKRFLIGSGLTIVAIVSGYSIDFSIGYAAS